MNNFCVPSTILSNRCIVFTFQLVAQLPSLSRTQPKVGQNGICLSRGGLPDATDATCTYVTQTTSGYASIDTCALLHGAHGTLLAHATDDNTLSNCNS